MGIGGRGTHGDRGEGHTWGQEGGAHLGIGDRGRGTHGDMGRDTPGDRGEGQTWEQGGGGGGKDT